MASWYFFFMKSLPLISDKLSQYFLSWAEQQETIIIEIRMIIKRVSDAIEKPRVTKLFMMGIIFLPISPTLGCMQWLGKTRSSDNILNRKLIIKQIEECALNLYFSPNLIHRFLTVIFKWKHPLLVPISTFNYVF